MSLYIKKPFNPLFCICKDTFTYEAFAVRNCEHHKCKSLSHGTGFIHEQRNGKP